MRISDWSSDVCSSDLQAVADGKRWVTGEIFGLPIPADAEALRSSGCEFLTTAFRASGALADDNGVSRIVGAEEFNGRSEEHTSELQSLMRISYAVFCLKKKKKQIETIKYTV